MVKNKHEKKNLKRTPFEWPLYININTDYSFSHDDVNSQSVIVCACRAKKLGLTKSTTLLV